VNLGARVSANGEFGGNLDGSRPYAVDGYPGRPEFAGKGADESFETGLGCGVPGQIDASELDEYRGDR
jgi:hypothetical protein